MKIAIIYASKYGAIREAVSLMGESIRDDISVEVFDLSENARISPEDYDLILLDSSVYAGKIRPEMKEFCTKNKEKLQEKPVAFFLCSAFNKNEEDLKNNFDPQLLARSLGYANFGYLIQPQKLSLGEKLIVKMIPKKELRMPQLLPQEINAFIQKLGLS